LIMLYEQVLCYKTIFQKLPNGLDYGLSHSISHKTESLLISRKTKKTNHPVLRMLDENIQ